MEEHAAAEAVRRAAATRSRPNEAIRTGDTLFVRKTLPIKREETALRGRYLRPAALIGPHGRSSRWERFGGEGIFECKRIAWAWTKEDSWVSCPGQPARYLRALRTSHPSLPPVVVPRTTKGTRRAGKRQPGDWHGCHCPVGRSRSGSVIGRNSKCNRARGGDLDRVLDSKPWLKSPFAEAAVSHRFKKARVEEWLRRRTGENC